MHEGVHGGTERPFSPAEDAVVRKLLERPFAGSDELLAQLETARASVGCDCGCPTVAIGVDRTLPPAPVRGSVALEAWTEARDTRVEVLLFVRGGYMSALELVWYPDAPVREWPDPKRSNVINYDEPTRSDGS